MIHSLKRALLVLCAFTIVFPFSSCEKDEDNDNSTNLVIGDYRLKEAIRLKAGETEANGHIKFYYNSEGRMEESVDLAEGYSEEFSYNAAGKPTLYKYIDSDSPEESYSISITWDGDTVSVTSTDTEDQRYKITLNQKGEVQKVEIFVTVFESEILVAYSDFVWKNNNLESMIGYSLGELDASAKMFTANGKLNFEFTKALENPEVLLLKSNGEMQKSYEERLEYDDKINPVRVYPLAQFEFPAKFSANNLLRETWIDYDQGKVGDTHITFYTYTYNEDDYPVTAIESWIDSDGQTYSSLYSESYFYELAK